MQVQKTVESQRSECRTSKNRPRSELLSGLRLGGGLLKSSRFCSRLQVQKTVESRTSERQTSKNRPRSELLSGLRLGSGLLKGSQVRKFKKRSKVKGLNVERLKTVQGLSYFLG